MIKVKKFSKLINLIIKFFAYIYLYNKTRHSYILFPIAGQKAGPNGLKFSVDTHGWPGGVLD